MSKQSDTIDTSMMKLNSIISHRMVSSSHELDTHDKLVFCLEDISQLIDYPLTCPAKVKDEVVETFIQQVSSLSQINIRKVKLEKNWFNSDLGVLLGFFGEDPCILKPESNQGYTIILSDGKHIKARNNLDKFCDFAYSFIVPLPEDISSFKSLFYFIFKEVKPKIFRLFLLQFCLTALAMVIPISMGYFFNNLGWLIDTNISKQIVVIFLINATIFALLSMNQTIMIVYMKIKVHLRLSPAVWDRILKLPIKFLRTFQTGDLANRAGSLRQLQEMVGHTAVVSFFTFVLSIVPLVVMIFISPELALIMMFFIAILLVFYLGLYFKLLKINREVYAHTSKQAGTLYQFINGIVKFKAIAGEHRAFKLWGDIYYKLIKSMRHRENTIKKITILSSGLFGIMSLLLFFFYFYFFRENVSLGNFIAFNMAFSQFLMSIFTFSLFLATIIEAVPLFERIFSVIKHDVTKRDRMGSAIRLKGGMQIKNLHFKYPTTKNPLLKNINLSIEPNQKIGITGESGCGKSTLFQLMLGLEKPDEGSIYYDHNNIELINPVILRQQIGVVTNRSRLIPGSLFENIIGASSNISRKDVLDLIRELGFMDLINKLPMGINTFINDGIQSLSGGEMQRIFLARALIAHPKILFLDEATSALDSQNQAKVELYLKKLQITQVIIAHRLTTLKSCDKIVTIVNGEITEEGTFDELMALDGYFAQLARFQLKT